MKEASTTIEELKSYENDFEAYVLYLLRIKAFKTMADMARDMGVKAGTIRQIKRRGKKCLN